MQIEKLTAEIDGEQIHYSRLGAGRPLLLLHGLLGGSFCWRRNMEAFSRQHTVYAIDLPGHGESDAPRHLDCSMATQADRVAGLLSHGQKQWLEIGMLLMQEPKLLLLDEPVAGMSDEETERTAELFASLAGEHSLVVVEHDMAFIETIARKVTVLHEGSVLAEGPMEQVKNDPRVVEVYLGR